MKLGLLVVLAVVALVPSLSESRVVSKCELREELGKAIRLPRRLWPFKDVILAIVTCEVEKRSNFDTAFTRVYGYRKPTTTAKPTVPTTAGGNETITKATTKSMTKAPTTTRSPTTAKPAVTTAGLKETTTKATTKSMTKAPTTTRSPTTAKPAVTTAGLKETTTKATTKSMTKAPTTTRSPTTAEPMSTNSSSGSNSTVDGGRKKRGAPSKTSENPDTEESLADVMNEVENKFDENEMMDDDNNLNDDEEDDTEEDTLEEDTDSGRDKRSLRRKHRKSKSKRRRFRSWSLAYYGIFQLSDSHFCHSGYRWSRNVCRSSCLGFTDDNIKDDVACFVKSGYWRFLLRAHSHKCRRTMKTYFAECD